jgi:EAL domain-containing protein (putative c-di-GMP-specific phosphodiesterase class I)
MLESMSQSHHPPEPVTSVQDGSHDSSLPSLGECLATVGDRFHHNGVVGLLVIDVAVVERVEEARGEAARRQVLATFNTLIEEVGEERLDIDDLLVAGETGRNEILVWMFREHRDARFYRQEIPGFDQALRKKLEHAGSKVFYPYLRSVPEIVTGMAVKLRNPKYGIDTQVRQVLSEAREDAVLNRRIQARKRRRRFHELILDGGIYSVYEPIVEVHSRVVFGYEALARGPEGSKFHQPTALFEAAEAEGLVYELDCLCRASGLKGAVGFPEGTKLFLNILPTTIHDPNFRAERLIKTLEECQLSPSDVVFEISEQESIANFGVFREMSDHYRSLGFQFALDDTGSGYAGLESLLELSPEFIKIDRAFVSGVDIDPVRQDMLRALQSMAKKIGARLVGEGLSTLEELEMLGELDIDFGQGWLFGHPTPLRSRT